MYNIICILSINVFIEIKSIKIIIKKEKIILIRIKETNNKDNLILKSKYSFKNNFFL